MGSVSKAFPATAWPLNRSEAGIGHAALAPAGLGGAVALIPTLSPVQFRADGAAGASWHPAAVQHGLRTYGQLSEPRAPVTLRPPTQIPGFLAQDTSPSHSHMVYNFRRAHGDLDIPHELLASEFRDAEAAGSWGGLPAIKGGTVAICRPALGEQQPEHPPPATRARADAAEDGLAVLRHEMNVDPVLSGRSTRGTGSELARAPLWSSRREWAMYAGGECGNELWALPLPSADDVVQGFPSLQRRDIDAVAEATVGPSIEFTTPIRQVVARAAHPGFVCVRTDSMVATVALSQCHWGAEWAPNVDADVAGHPYSYDSGDRWTCHVSWSPWRAAETALASGTGTVRLWDCIASCETMLKDADQAGDYDIQWNCCEYWSSPRQLLCANPDTLYCLDARAGRTQTAIMTLRDSPFASSGEVFTAVCPSALHPLHAVAASSHAIRVFDQRYLRQPVMAWALGSTPADPPIYLQSELLPGSAAGHAACIFAATEKSSRVYGYVYGQGGSDQPYTSLDQFMLRPGSHTSPGHEAIQDALAVDPQSNEDMTSAYTHVSEYPTARLAGFAFHCLDTAADTAGGGPVVDAVCVCVDELGAVVGHHIVVAPDAPAGDGFEAPRTAYGALLNSGVWGAARDVDGATIDGMNCMLRTCRDNSQAKEAAWAELRKRSEAYMRVDMSGVYSALLEHAVRTPSGAHSPVLAAAAAGEALRKRIQMMLVRDASAYEVLCAAAPVTRAGVRPFASGPDLRRRLLGLAAHAAYNGPGGLQVPDLADALCSDPAGPAAHAPAASHDIGRALERIFAHGNVPPGALVQRALDRAAEDIALARTRLRSQPPAEHDGAQSPTSAPHAMPVMARCVALGPGDDDGGLGSLVGAARVLSGLWADGPVGAGALELRSGLADATSQRARAPKSRSTTAPPGPGEQGTAPTWPLTSAPSASSPRPGAAEAPRPATMDAFAAASAQPHSPPVARHRTLDSQAKKGKARKRGF